ncbi:hypothetical protein BBJ28_00026123 [Nothophytophthora sp. Chile5]|nr:hypothetical protein BBJ28_00026123 [Nothophytophthora sp. Chile5]
MPLNMPYHSTMDKEIVKAATILDSCFRSTIDADSAIPAEMIQKAAGLAFLTVVKAGMIWTGKLGTGVVIARLEDGSWSPPSGIGTAGVGFGAEIGGEIVDFLIVLGSPSAVKTFKKGTQVSVGAGLDLAVGPVGRAAGASLNASGGGISSNYTYSHAKGAFAGVGLHGSTIMIRGDMNSQFYGRKVTPMEILSGHRTSSSSSASAMPPPSTAQADPDDPRLRRYGQYKSERELYAQFEQRKSGSFGTPPAAAAAVAAQSMYAHPTNPSLKYKSYPAPAPNAAYTAPPEAQAMYNSFVKPAPAPSQQQPVPPIPGAAKGAEMKEVYANVMNFVQTKCPYANLQAFKDNCRLFGQDAMSLDAFFSYLLSICSHPQMKELVPQLVRLLPTQEKRERLWTLYVREVLLIKI